MTPSLRLALSWLDTALADLRAELRRLEERLTALESAPPDNPGRSTNPAQLSLFDQPGWNAQKDARP